jgi:hypothetical protein
MYATAWSSGENVLLSLRIYDTELVKKKKKIGAGYTEVKTTAAT